MKEIIVKTQEQLDAIKPDFDGTIYLEGGTRYEPLVLRVRFENAEVIARGDCQLDMWGNSTVQDMWGNSTVQDMRENSTVQRMWENSTVQDMWENSTVQRMRENSTAQNLYGEAMVSAYGLNKITCHGYNIVRTTSDNKKNLTLVMSKDSHLIVVPKFKATFADYAKRYPVDVKDSKAVLYKAVHKRDGKYFSDFDSSFEYEVGKTYKHENAPKSAGACAQGLHIATKDWAISFGKNWSDYALLECEVPVKNIVVAEDCDGKVRTSNLKILREVTEE